MRRLGRAAFRAEPDTDRYRAACLALLDLASPGDALTTYYLLDHPASLARRALLQPAGTGVISVCHVGAGNHPLVVLRCGQAERIPELLGAALEPGVKHFFIVPPGYRPALEAALNGITERSTTVIHTATPDSLGRATSPKAGTPVTSGPVVEAFTRNGLPGYRIVIDGRPVASCLTSWRSARFAEIGVSTSPPYQRRGHGSAVVRLLAADLVRSGVTPLYVADKDNLPSLALAASAGYRPSGHEEFSCAGAI